MCALLPAWLCLLLGFLPLEIQSRALTLQTLTHRFNLPKTTKHPKSSYTAMMPAASDLPLTADHHSAHGDRHIIWRGQLHKEPLPRLSAPLLDHGDSLLTQAPSWQRRSRGRRHVNGRGHGHLMRVGCVLGTCQVQNLSHRLYQLIGQSGREDSSPINPRSPHSYG
ncbi:uncharacterized protein V6R79_000838 [Siganus canaliculatus]